MLVSNLKGEIEETKAHYERSEKSKKTMEVEYQELEQRLTDQSNQLSKAIADRKKYESDLMAASEELQECRFELKSAEDRLRATSALVMKKEEELRNEKEVCDNSLVGLTLVLLLKKSCGTLRIIKIY